MTNINQNNVATNTTLADALVFNNRFANASLNADQLGAEGLAQWKTIVKNLHRSAYIIASQCENNGLKVENSTVDKTPVYDAIKAIFANIGEINGRKLYVNEQTAIAIIGYASKRVNSNSANLQFCLSRIANAKKELRLAESVNGIDQAYIDGLKKTIEEQELIKDKLLNEPDNRHKVVTITTDNAFRLDVEHFIARAIVDQLAKTIEELDKEAEERKAARAAARKAKKASK